MKYSHDPDRVASRPSVGVLHVWGAAAVLAVALLGGPLLAGCGPGEAGPSADPGGDRTSAAVSGELPTIDGCDGCSVVLISIDTLRADRLGTYGNPHQPSPHLDALAAGGVLFERAYSASYHTAESHMSMMTSLYPSVHMVRNAAGGGGRRLDEGVSTLAEILRGRGYATAGFHGGGNVGRVYGFDRGFDVYRRADGVDRAIGWLERRQEAGADEPFFLFFHTYHPHDPYTPSPEWVETFDPGYDGPILSDRERLLEIVGEDGFQRLRDEFWSRVDSDDPREIQHLLALYDGEIAEIDRRLERLLAHLDTLPEPPLILLVSDHGEEFQEHGKFLHDQLYNELLHVPWMIRGPGVPEGVRVEARVSLLSLAPTLLDLVGLTPPEQFQGRSVAPLIAVAAGEGLAAGGGPIDPASVAPGPIYAEKVQANPTRRLAAGRGVSVFGLIEGNHKLIVKNRPEIYDLNRDPGEQEPIDDRGRLRLLGRQAREMANRNERHREALGVPLEAEVKQLDDETRQELKALGYIQ